MVTLFFESHAIDTLFNLHVDNFLVEYVLLLISLGLAFRIQTFNKVPIFILGICREFGIDVLNCHGNRFIGIVLLDIIQNIEEIVDMGKFAWDDFFVGYSD